MDTEHATDAELSQAAKRSLRRRLRPMMTAVALMGFLLWVPVEKLFMTHIGFDAASIGIMAAAYAALTPIVEVPSGILADRWSRRGVLIISAIALALASLVGGLSHNVATYVGSALILAVYFAMYSGTVDAIVYDTILEEIGTSITFQRQIGRVRAVESGALVIGALAGGLVAELASPRLTYFLTVPFATLAAVALLRFREPQLHKSEERTTLRGQISVTYRAIARTPGLLPVVVLALLAAVLASAIFEFGPLWLVAHDAPEGLYGPYWAALMATLGIGGLVAGRITLQRRPVLTAVAASLVLASLALTLPNLAVAIGAQVVLTFLLIVASIRATQLLHDAVPSAIRTGVASGVSALGWMCFFPFALGLGWLSRSAGVHTAAWMVVAGTALACAALWVVAHRQPYPVKSAAEALTTQLLRDVRRCLLERRNEIDTIDCTDAVELVTEFLEGGLELNAELRFVNHLANCPGCTDYVDQMRQTIGLLRGIPEPEHVPAAARTTLLATFRESMESPN